MSFSRPWKASTLAISISWYSLLCSEPWYCIYWTKYALCPSYGVIIPICSGLTPAFKNLRKKKNSVHKINKWILILLGGYFFYIWSFRPIEITCSRSSDFFLTLSYMEKHGSIGNRPWKFHFQFSFISTHSILKATLIKEVGREPVKDKLWMIWKSAREKVDGTTKR